MTRDGYNPGVIEHRHLPDADNLSILSAIILLAYVIARFVDIPLNEFTVQLPGLYLNFELSIRTIITLLVAGLAASGAEWLLRQHPRLREQKTFDHWILTGYHGLGYRGAAFSAPAWISMVDMVDNRWWIVDTRGCRRVHNHRSG